MTQGFVEAADAELDELRTALAPAVAVLDEDASSARFLGAIDELKRERQDPPTSFGAPPTTRVTQRESSSTAPSR